jgi:CheY-like chemotaxis protein/HPt (histidine-containing phosphotransfer) domain-containing protein
MVVTLAENGQQALDILKPNPSKFDCVLMDCQMPVMDGYTATRELRKLPEFANLPIIAMTANAMIGDKEKVLEAGMWDHISKPLNVKVMLETIAKHMPSSSSAQKNPTHDPLNPPAASTATEPFAGLVGIDIASGLASTMNNQALYMRMLEMFYQSQSDFGQQFVNACADPDSSAPMRLAHTLKGSAGNIGAKAVQQVADLLEQACKDKASAAQISELVKRVEDELAPVLLSVATLLNNKTANTENANGLDREQFNEKIQQLRHLLNESDSNATDFVNALLDEVQGAQWAKQWARELDTIKRHIEKYDFDIALECLDKIQR